MHEKLDIQKLSKHVLESSQLANSPTSQRLLTFLVDSALRGEVPKETTIAMEVFGKDADFDPGQDPLVRVHVYQLRKKLKAFYEDKGPIGGQRLVIPKGSYQLQVESVPEVELPEEKQDLSWIGQVALALIIFVSGIGVSMLAFLPEEPSNSSLPISSIWTNLLSQEEPLSIVIGDVYVYQEFDSALQKYRTIRDAQVNSREDFLAMRDSLSEEKAARMREMNYSFTIKNSVYGLQQLHQVLGPANKAYQIRMASAFDMAELYDHDVMYLGLFKTLGVFEQFLAGSQIAYERKDSQEIIHIQGENGPLSFQSSGPPEALHTDYAWFAKLPGSDQHSIWLFAGFHDTGVMQSVKQLTDKGLLQGLEKEMQERWGEIPEYFEGLVEVQGINRTEMLPKLVYLSRIDWE
ncbi:MAG: helix-turn-helix domain-containing protein [Bacteroidota bacterium]